MRWRSSGRFRKQQCSQLTLDFSSECWDCRSLQANCLFATTVGIYEGDYREMMHQPALLALDPEISRRVLLLMEVHKLAISLQQPPQRPVLLFITVSAILLINLLIAFPSVHQLVVFGGICAGQCRLRLS